MKSDPVFFRELGEGPSVICLHANASSSGQWRALMERLAPKYHVASADCYGAGKSPVWHGDSDLMLRDEVALLEPVFMRASQPFVLVGHSYGGAVALVAALAQPKRVRALALYEPTLFSLLDSESPSPNEADGIRNAVQDAVTALKNNKPADAARCFIDFWMGSGAWDKSPERNQAAIASAIVHVDAWKKALFGEPTPLHEFAKLDVPILLMEGENSPGSSLGVARLLNGVLPQVEVEKFEGFGHMAPVIQPDVINETISNFIDRLP